MKFGIAVSGVANWILESRLRVARLALVKREARIWRVRSELVGDLTWYCDGHRRLWTGIVKMG